MAAFQHTHGSWRQTRYFYPRFLVRRFRYLERFEDGQSDRDRQAALALQKPIEGHHFPTSVLTAVALFHFGCVGFSASFQLNFLKLDAANLPALVRGWLG